MLKFTQVVLVAGYWFLFVSMTNLSWLFWKVDGLREGVMRAINIVGLATPLIVYHWRALRSRVGWLSRLFIAVSGVAASILIRYVHFGEVAPLGVSPFLDVGLIVGVYFLAAEFDSGRRLGFAETPGEFE